MSPPPPPPPPPLCFPFGSNSNRERRLSWSTSSQPPSQYAPNPLVRSGSYSTTATLTSQAESLAFKSDSEAYDVARSEFPPTTIPRQTKLIRANTIGRDDSRALARNNSNPLKRSDSNPLSRNKSSASKWGGYGWGLGKAKRAKEIEQEVMEKAVSVHSSSTAATAPASPPASLPVSAHASPPVSAHTSPPVSAHASPPVSAHASPPASPLASPPASQPPSRQSSKSSNVKSHHSRHTHSSPLNLTRSNSRRPQLLSSDSSSTLVGSAYERKINEVESIKSKVDTSDRLEELRKLMLKDNLDYYVVPSEDSHQSEYVASSDKRREFISGFTGNAGQAVVSKTSAYLITDSRYWLQAQDELDSNWHIIMAGSADAPKDWIDWLIDRVKDSRIGIDARMIAHETASCINSKLTSRSSKLVFPPQNLVDLVWKDKPPKPKEHIFIQPIEFSGKEASTKLEELRAWIKAQPPATLSYSKSPPTPAQMHVSTLITSLSCIAYLLNLRGSDIPFNPLFHAYFFISEDRAILFIDSSKVVNDDVNEYLKSLDIEQREYNDLWTFLRRREWGEGKVLISPQTSYAISLMLTHFRYTVAPSFIEDMKAVKNETELEGMRRAYTRDGASFVRFLAWLEYKLAQGYEITEYEAASRLTEFRRKNKYFMGLAYENISASGSNAALPHYSPSKSTARMINRETPYLNDSGGQYRDGTCDTTRTVHYGRPTPEQCEAFTRVLQGHIAIDSAFFPEGTSGVQLDVLARKALWKNGLNYHHGTGHGFGSFLNVHEGPQGFSTSVPLVPGHVVTNEPGYYNTGKWGMRIESALAVKRVKTKGHFDGDIWLGFERLTCVPIQTRMVKESMLSKEDRQWLKDHNQRCKDKLEPYLKDDKRALKWLRREAERGIGIVGTGPISIDWSLS